MAINAGVRNYIGNYSQLDAYESQFSVDIRETKPNIGFSVMFYSSNYYLGISVPELSVRTLGTASALQPNYLRWHYHFTGGVIADLNDYLKIKPSTLILYTKGLPMVGNLSATAYVKETAGAQGQLPHRQNRCRNPYALREKFYACIQLPVWLFNYSYGHQYNRARSWRF